MQGSGRSGAEGRVQSVNCYKCYRVSCICRARSSDVCTDAPVPAGFVNTQPGADSDDSVGGEMEVEMDVGSQGGEDEAQADDDDSFWEARYGELWW